MSHDATRHADMEGIARAMTERTPVIERRTVLQAGAVTAAATTVVGSQVGPADAGSY